MEYVKTVREENMLMPELSKIYHVYKLSIDEMIQRWFPDNSDVTFVKRTDKTFVFSFVPKKYWCHDAITKEPYLSEPLKWGGAKYTKRLSACYEFIKIEVK